MRALRELVEEVVAKGLETLPTPKEFPEMPFDSVFGALGAVRRELNRVPKDIFDATPVLAELASVQKAIASLPEPEKLDLSPVLAAVHELPRQIEAAVASAKADIQQVGKDVAKEIRTSLMAFEQEIVGRADKGLQDLLSRQSLTVPMSALTSRKEPEPIDVKHLM
jgi:hypothetical protein